MLALYQPLAGLFVTLIAAFLLDAAWKSPACSALLPLKAPFLISATMLPIVPNGLEPPLPACLILSVTVLITALSGRPAVSNDRTLRYCAFEPLSPRRNVVPVALIEPPTPLVSLVSRT